MRSTVLWADPRVSRAVSILFKPLLRMGCAFQQAFLETELPKITADFGEPMPSMLRLTQPSSITSIAALEKAPHSLHDNGVVYIGDAWHPMTPASGMTTPSCTVKVGSTSACILPVPWGCLSILSCVGPAHAADLQCPPFGPCHYTQQKCASGATSEQLMRWGVSRTPSRVHARHNCEVRNTIQPQLELHRFMMVCLALQTGDLPLIN